MILSLRCAWFPIAPATLSGVTRFNAFNTHIFASSLKEHAGCLWYNNHRHDTFKLEQLDEFDEYFCDDYNLSPETIIDRLMGFNKYDVEHTVPNVVMITNGNHRYCVMVTPIFEGKTRVFIFFKKDMFKDSDSIFERKFLKYKIRLYIESNKKINEL